MFWVWFYINPYNVQETDAQWTQSNQNVILPLNSRVLIHRVAMDRLLEKYGVEGKQFWLGFGGYSKIPKMGSGGNCVEVDYRGKEEILQIPYSNSENNFWIALVKQMP